MAVLMPTTSPAEFNSGPQQIPMPQVVLGVRQKVANKAEASADIRAVHDDIVAAPDTFGWMREVG
jgi:hypothetical protein